MSAECIGKKLRTESSDSVAILLGAGGGGGWPIGSALPLVAHDAWVVLATLAAGCGRSSTTTKNSDLHCSCGRFLGRRWYGCEHWR